jgi:hypothetical protein
MTMDPVSIEIILKSVEWLAGALANVRESPSLPEGMKCQRRQENILVLSLLRLAERFSGEESEQSGRERGRDRAQSIWTRGGVPRNGGL